MGQGLEALFGQVLENTYRITRLIGEGGMGAVYEAEHSRLPRRFAIKVLFPHVASNAVAVERFHREALITSELGHPHIVDVIDFNHTPEGLPYIVMEFLSGEDLEARMERAGRMSLNAVNRIIEMTASALEAVHIKNIVHRDLKPQNVFLCDKDGVDDYVKVVDFGISKIRGAGQALTRAHMVMGTPYYMSPEQAKGHADEADRRADIFALGAMAYEMLTGRLPFHGETPDVVLYQVVHETPPGFEELGLDIPPAVEDAVFTAIAKNPDERWETMAEMSEAFSNAAERTVIDFSPLDDVSSLPEAQPEDKKPTNRLNAVAQPGQIEGTAPTQRAPALTPSATEPLDTASVMYQELLPEELGTEPRVKGGRGQHPAAGTSPGLGPSSDLSARTTPSPMQVPDALAETAPQVATATPPPSAQDTQDDSVEAKTSVMDTRLLHDMQLLEQPTIDNDEVDTFKEHKSAAPPGSPLDQAYQQGLHEVPTQAVGGQQLNGSTISSTMGEIQQNKPNGSRLGLFLVIAFLLVGGGLTFGAVRLMGSSNVSTKRAAAKPATPGEKAPAAVHKDASPAAKQQGPDAGAPADPPPDKQAARPVLPVVTPTAKTTKPATARPESTRPSAARQITITSSPKGARVVINRKLAGWTPLKEHQIPAGKIKVVVTRPGYKRVDRTIPAGDGRPRLNLKLEARAKKPALGFLRVATLLKGKPSRAFIFINGKRAGESPLRISLPKGSHRVEAWRRGIKSSSKRVTVTAGKTQLVILRLKGK